MYSQQNNPNQGANSNVPKVSRCKDCLQNNRITLIQWIPNPDKPGINPSTGRPYVIPIEVNTQQRHNCPFRQMQMQQQQLPAVATGRLNTTMPGFTQNDTTVKDILEQMKTVVKQNEQIIELLEILAGEKTRKGIHPAAQAVQEQEEYVAQNRTAHMVDD